MDEDGPGLHADFVINSDGAMAEILRFAQLFDDKTVQFIRDAARIEQAVGGIKLSRASQEVREFAGTTASSMRAAEAAIAGISGAISTVAPAIDKATLATNRSMKKSASEAESLIRNLNRQATTAGMTFDQLQLLKAAELELANRQLGNTEVADRLAEATRGLAKARDAVARSKLDDQLRAEAAAARDVAAAEEAVIVQLREHARLQAALNRTNGADRPRAISAGATYSALAAQAEETERLAVAAERLRASVDPAYAAQQRFNQEMGRARQLVSAGAVGLDDYCAKLRIEQGLLEQTVGVQQRVGAAHRFTALEVLNLSRQFQDIGVTAAMGMNPFMILVQQGPQIYDVLEQAKARGVNAGAAMKQMGSDVLNYGVAGYGRLIALLTPANLLLAGTVLVTIAAARALGSYGAAMERFEGTAAGVGRVAGQTAQQLESISEAAAASGERSLSATRDSVNAFAAAGIQGGATLTLLAANVERYAKLTGQDVPAAQAALAEAIKDPARAAETFTEQLGLLSGAQYQHIQQLVAQGDQEQAAAELTRILTGDLAANADQAIGVAKVMDVLGGAVAGVATFFGKLDQRIKSASASYDDWLKRSVGGWAVDLIGTGNKAPKGPNANAGRNQDQIAALNASDSMNTAGMKQINELLAKRSLLWKGLRDTTGLTAEQVRALNHDFTAVTDTLNANRTATGGWITTQERAHLVAQAQAKLAGAHTKAEKAAAQQQITRLQLGTQVLTQTERQTQATDAYNKVANRYTKPKTDRHAEQLARDAEAIEAQTRNLYALGAAYDTSGAAALIAEARVKAESDAIKKRGDVETMVDRQVQLAIAQRVADATRSAAAVRNEAGIQAEVNAMVAAGLVPAERANDLVRDRIAELPLLAAIEAAQQRGLKTEVEKATAALKAQQDARTKAKAAEIGAFYTGADQQADRQLALQREELRLVGATDMERVRAMATIQATQVLQAKGYDLTSTYAKDFVAKQVAIATGAETVRQAQDEWNASLGRTSELFDEIDRSVQSAAGGMADAFGEVGRSIGDVASIMSGYYADQASLQQQHEAAIRKAGASEAAIAHENRLFAIRSASAQVGAYGDMLGAAKGFFKEGSAGYKAMAAAEKVYRVAQLAMSVAAMVQNVAETTTSVANAAARATADGTAGIAAQAKLPFPANIAAMAATGAALVAAGIAVFGGKGGGSAPPVTNTGTGTVLGDPAAQSESLKRSIDQLREVDTTTSVFARQMAGSLRSIDDQIGGLAAVLVRSGNVDASSGVTEGFKTNAVGSILSKIPVVGGILGGLFGTKTSVIGSGLYGGAQSVGDILSNGFDAQTYSDVEKKKKLFGITTSTKTSTQYAAADAGLENQFTLILKSFATAIDAAAGPLGEATGDVEARLNGFVVNIGKIDLKGLTGTQIQEKLEAVFGAAADGMAEAAFPGVSRFQKAGEGAFETLVRVASTLEAVSSSLDLLGTSARAMSIDAKLGLADQFDSVSDLTGAVESYFTTYYSKAEQSAAKTAQLGRVFDSLGLAMPATLAGFRGLVEAQDLTTTAGQSTYATLLQLAPAFADLQEALGATKSAADIASERLDLEQRLLELRGDTAAIRAAQLAKLDASNRALQQEIYAVQDAQEAAKAADELAKAWSGVGDSIMDEINRIRGLDSVGGDSFATLLGRFNAANTAARGGDMDAAKGLPALSQALLGAAADAATSAQELARVRAETAAALEATYGVVGALSARPATSTTDTVASAADSRGTASISTVANDDTAAELRALREEMAGMRQDNNVGNATIAANTGRVAKKLDDVTPSGNAVSVAA